MKKSLYLGLDPQHYVCTNQIVHWPIIEIVARPLSSVQPYLSQFHLFTHVIITSKSSISILIDYLSQLAISLEQWKIKHTLAVGKATAHALQALEISSQVAEIETAEGVVAELEKISDKNAYFFWPHSAQARSIITDYLTARSMGYTACPLYDVKTYLPGPLPNLNAFDEIIFTSPSTVQAFLDIFGQFPAHVRLTPIGPVTAHYLQSIQCTF